jgi:hypothetical protein
VVVALVIPTCRRTKINRRTMAPVGVVDRQMRLLIDKLEEDSGGGLPGCQDAD